MHATKKKQTVSNITVTNNNIEEFKPFFELIKSFLLITIDDELDPEVQSFLSYQPKEVWKDNAYIYLWGMGAKTESPYKAGVQIVKSLDLANDNYQYKQSPFDESFLDDFQFYSIPKGKTFCQLKNRNCFEYLLSISESEKKEIISQNANFLSRYKKFLSYNDFKSIKNFNFDAPIPSYRLIEVGYQLSRLKFISQLKYNGLDSKKFHIEFDLIRNKLAQTNSLIAKMVLLSICNDYIELMSLTKQKFDNMLQLNHTINQLTLEEISTYSALKNEHVSGLRLMYDVANNIEWFLKPKERKPWTVPLTKLLMHIVLKPNLTVNSQHKFVVEPMLEFSTIDAKSFHEKIKSVKIKSTRNWIRNYLSSKLLENVNDYKKIYLSYPARIHSFNMKIKLLNAYLKEKSFDAIINKAQLGYKPYLNDFDQSMPSIKEGKICYSGLYDFNEPYRCLKTLNALNND